MQRIITPLTFVILSLILLGFSYSHLRIDEHQGLTEDVFLLNSPKQSTKTVCKSLNMYPSPIHSNIQEIENRKTTRLTHFSSSEDLINQNYTLYSNVEMSQVKRGDKKPNFNANNSTICTQKQGFYNI